MTDDTMPLLDALLKRGGGDFMKELAEEVLGRLMAYDVEGQIGAGRYERNEERTTRSPGMAARNGYRHRAFDTRLGTLEAARRSRSCAKARTSPASSSRGAPPSRPWWR